jgi:HEPN domain-containing protein
MDKHNIVNEWLNIAEMDMASANFLQDMHPIPVEIICYHCQQSAEKYLKGYLAFKEEEILKTQDLLALNSLCQKYDKKFLSINEECLRLTDYGVNIRYPYPMDLNKSDMEIALKDLQKIKNFILSKIK